MFAGSCRCTPLSKKDSPYKTESSVPDPSVARSTRAGSPFRGAEIQVALRAILYAPSAHFICRRSWLGASRRLKQESSPKATPLKAVSRLPSAVGIGSGRARVSSLSVFQSFSLPSRVQMSHYNLVHLCTLHFALSNRNMREAHPELLISNCYLLISHFPHMLQYNDRKNGNFIGIYIDARYV